MKLTAIESRRIVGDFTWDINEAQAVIASISSTTASRDLDKALQMAIIEAPAEARYIIIKVKTGEVAL